MKDNEYEISNFEFIKNMDVPELAAWIAISHSKILSNYGIQVDRKEILDIANIYIDWFLSDYKENTMPNNVIGIDFAKIKK